MKAMERQTAISAELKTLFALPETELVNDSMTSHFRELMVEGALITMREEYRCGVSVEDILSPDRYVAIMCGTLMEDGKEFTSDDIRFYLWLHEQACPQFLKWLEE
jgi:hypothetical protein